jgi:hypothetical protein
VSAHTHTRRERLNITSKWARGEQMFYVWWMVPYYKMPLPQAWMGRYEADIKRTALYTRLRDEGMDPAQLSLPADPRGRAVDARAAATLARLAAGEL